MDSLYPNEVYNHKIKYVNFTVEWKAAWLLLRHLLCLLLRLHAQ